MDPEEQKPSKRKAADAGIGNPVHSPMKRARLARPANALLPIYTERARQQAREFAPPPTLSALSNHFDIPALNSAVFPGASAVIFGATAPGNHHVPTNAPAAVPPARDDQQRSDSHITSPPIPAVFGPAASRSVVATSPFETAAAPFGATLGTDTDSSAAPAPTSVLAEDESNRTPGSPTKEVQFAEGTKTGPSEKAKAVKKKRKFKPRLKQRLFGKKPATVETDTQYVPKSAEERYSPDLTSIENRKRQLESSEEGQGSPSKKPKMSQVQETITSPGADETDDEDKIASLEDEVATLKKKMAHQEERHDKAVQDLTNIIEEIVSEYDASLISLEDKYKRLESRFARQQSRLERVDPSPQPEGEGEEAGEVPRQFMSVPVYPQPHQVEFIMGDMSFTSEVQPPSPGNSVARNRHSLWQPRSQISNFDGADEAADGPAEDARADHAHQERLVKRMEDSDGSETESIEDEYWETGDNQSSSSSDESGSDEDLCELVDIQGPTGSETTEDLSEMPVEEESLFLEMESNEDEPEDPVDSLKLGSPDDPSEGGPSKEDSTETVDGKSSQDVEPAGSDSAESTDESSPDSSEEAERTEDEATGPNNRSIHEADSIKDDPDEPKDKPSSYKDESSDDEPAEPAQPAQPVQLAKSAEPVKRVKSVEAVGPVEPVTEVERPAGRTGGAFYTGTRSDPVENLLNSFGILRDATGSIRNSVSSQRAGFDRFGRRLPPHVYRAQLAAEASFSPFEVDDERAPDAEMIGRDIEGPRRQAGRGNRPEPQ